MNNKKQVVGILAVEEVLNPSKPFFVTSNSLAPDQGKIKTWLESLDLETQQTAKKILQMLGEQKYTKDRLQNAATQYGFNVKESLKMAPKSLSTSDFHCSSFDVLTSSFVY